MKVFFIRATILISALIIGATSLGLAAYCYGWIVYVGQAQDRIDALWREAPTAYQFTLTGDKPEIKGFPFVPNLSYAGRITHNPSGSYADIPKFTYRGFPAPTQIQNIDTPEGFELNLPLYGRVIHVKSASFNVNWPSGFYGNLDKESMAAWQKQNDPFLIRNLTIVADDIKMTGEGMMGLDDKLQIVGYINLRIVGMENIFNSFYAEEDKNSASQAMARRMLLMLIKTDESSGERYFETSLQVQEHAMFFGPLRVATLPPMPWEEGPSSEGLRRQKP